VGGGGRKEREGSKGGGRIRMQRGEGEGGNGEGWLRGEMGGRELWMEKKGQGVVRCGKEGGGSGGGGQRL